MIRKLLFLLCILGMPAMSYAESNGTYSIDELLERKSNGTPCATQIFANALAATADIIENPDDAGTSEINTWSQHAFSQPDVLEAVLQQCPEIASLKSEDTIVFDTVSYTFPPTETFPEGRLIQINYETQKGVLEQRFLLSTKRTIATGDISPDIYQDAQNVLTVLH